MVNKYARTLEEAGYAFAKDEKEHRAFVNHDKVAFCALLDFLNRGIEHQSAINAVVEQWAYSGVGDQVNGVLEEVRQAQERADQQLTEIAGLFRGWSCTASTNDFLGYSKLTMN
ncbi:hypothetical protein MHB54_17285 [Paenibacillus sp. FSL M7-0802]|uniref:Uncharacterized protein n=1 Tax=Paenibacillus polymyxa TaxID=1406 RepID=A0AAP4A5H6_PAEPO|nr:hypothetical protein [Paenibacillus polymyxa]MDH2333074.1 hypothetical protein [Paenibacillus polymyxa]